MDVQWDCEAYGPEGAEVGAYCFFSTHSRLCASQTVCHDRMVHERHDVWRAMVAAAQKGDPYALDLVATFDGPNDILGGRRQTPSQPGREAPGEA
jgi:hypothetical protein